MGQGSSNLTLTEDQYQEYQRLLSQHKKKPVSPQEYLEYIQKYKDQFTPEQYSHYMKQYHNYVSQVEAIRQRKMADARSKQAEIQRQRQQQQRQEEEQRQQHARKSQDSIDQKLHSQQRSRTQVRVENKHMENKMIPEMQHKPEMAYVENSYQDAYQSRLNDQFSSKPPTIYEEPEERPNLHNRSQLTHLARQQQQKPKQQQRKESPHIKNKFLDEMNEIEDYKYTPEQLLDLEPGVKYTKDQIKKAYRRLAQKHHPDKGGNGAIFGILTKAYLYLIKKLEGEDYVEKTFEDLKAGYEDYDERDARPIYGDEKEFDKKHFNEMFEKHRLEDDEADGGYGDWTSTDMSEEPKKHAKIFNQKFSVDVFNQVFNEYKDEKNEKEKQIIKFEEPKPMNISNRCGYTDIDYKKPDDYGKEYNIQDRSSKGKSYYMDYRKAHTETTLINPNHVQKREGFKSIEDAKLAREKQTFEMTDEERHQMELKKAQEEEAEHNRLERLKARDRQLADHKAKISQLMLGHSGGGMKRLQ